MKPSVKILFVLFSLIISLNGQSQTIGIAPIKTFGLFAEPEIAATITRLETIKLGKYQVLDRFDMEEVENADSFADCYGQKCLIELGNALDVDYLLSGNFDGLGNKIIITLKLIDVKEGAIVKTQTGEFDNQEVELQRMVGIVLQRMHGQTPDEAIEKQLAFRNEVITSNNVGRVKNSGPRMGIAYTTGVMNEFVTRPESQGGLDIAPIVTNIGYQFEGQYVGTDRFSALFEGIINFTALEQGQFIPSFSLLHGFRFGQQGWEIAFGPSFGLSRSSVGFFTKGGKELFGEIAPRYWTEDEFNALDGFPENGLEAYDYEYARHLDARGRLDINTRWVMAVGRTFRSGALNIPVNIFYSSQKKGGMLGLSMGFNITRKKTQIN